MVPAEWADREDPEEDLSDNRVKTIDKNNGSGDIFGVVLLNQLVIT